MRKDRSDAIEMPFGLTYAYQAVSSPIQDPIESLRARLAQDPNDADAFASLRSIYAGRGDYRDLADLLRQFAATARQAHQQSQLLCELGEVEYRHLSATEQGLASMAAALQADPLNVDASEALQAVLRKERRFEQLAQFLSDHIADLESRGIDATERAILSLRLGQVWGTDLADSQAALSWFEYALTLDPKLLRALYEARTLLAAQGQAAQAASLLQREADLESDQVRKVLLLRELADMAERTLGDHTRAEGALRQALQIQPADLDTLVDLGHGLARRASALADNIDAELLRSEAAEVLHQAGMKSTDMQRRRSLLTTSLNLEPGRHSTLSALEAMTPMSPPHNQQLAPLWVAYLQACGDGPMNQQRRLLLARAYMDCGQLDDAAYCLGDGLDPGLPRIRELSEELAALRAGQTPNRTALANPVTGTGDTATADVAKAVVTAPPTSSGAQDARQDTRQDAAHAGERVTAAPVQPRQSQHVPPESPAATSSPAVLPDPRSTTPPAQSPRPPSSAAAPPGPAATPAAPPSPPFADTQVPKPDVATEAPSPSSPIEPKPAPARVVQLGAARPKVEPSELADAQTRFAQAVSSKQRELAAQAARTLLELSPSHREAFNYLDAHLRRHRDHHGRTVLLEATGTRPEVALETRILRLREAAGLRESRLKDLDGAVALWKHIAEVDSDSDEAVRNLKRLGERLKRWNQVAIDLEGELGAAKSTDAQLQVLKRMCTLHVDQRLQPQRAIESLQALLALEHDTRREETLCQLLLQSDSPQSAAPLLRKRAAAATGEQRCALLEQLGELQERLGDNSGAYDAYQAALDANPNAKDALARLISLDRSTGNHQALVTRLEQRLRVAKTASEAASLALEMAQVQENGLHDPDAAGDTLTRTADDYPRETSLTIALTELFERHEKYEDLVEFLRERAVIEQNADARADLMIRTAEVLDKRLNDSEGAIAVLESLVKSHEDDRALELLEQKARSSQDAARLAHVLSRRVKYAADQATAHSMRMELARLYLEDLGREKDAIDLLVPLLDNQQHSVTSEVLPLLERACRITNRHEVLGRVWERVVDRTSDRATALRLCQDLAALYHNELPNRRLAAAALTRWSSLAPDAIEPLRALRPLLEARRAHEELRQLLDRLAQLSDDQDEIRAAVMAAAKLCRTELEDSEGVWTRLMPLVSMGDAEALTELEDLAREQGRLQHLCALLEAEALFDLLSGTQLRAAQSATRDADKVEWLRQAAITNLGSLQRPATAAEIFVQLLAIEEDAEALGFLLAQARVASDHQKIADYLGRLAALEASPDGKAALLLEQGQTLAAPLERHAQAAAVFEAALAIVGPTHEPTVEALTSAYRDADDHVNLHRVLVAQLDHLLAQADQAGSTEDRHPAITSAAIAICAEAADIALERLDDPASSAALLQRWSDLDSHNAEPLRKLRRIIERDNGVCPALVSVLDKLSQQETTEESRAQAALAASNASLQTGGSAQDAFARLAPFSVSAIPDIDSAASRLCQQAPELLEPYCELLQHHERFDELAAQLERSLAADTSQAISAWIHRRAARLYSTVLDVPADAERHYRSLLQRSEDEEALRFLRAQAMQADDPTALADYLGRLARLSAEKTQRRDLQFEQAHLLRARLGDIAGAAQIHRSLLRDFPTFAAAIDELAACCHQVGDWDGLAECYSKELAIETSAAQRTAIARRLVRLHIEQRRAPQDAMPALQAWTEATPEDTEPLHRMLDLADGPGQHELRRGIFDRLVEIEPDPDAKIAAQVSAGQLCAGEELDDWDGAMQRLLGLLAHLSPAADRALLSIARRQDKLEVLCDGYQQAELFDQLAALLHERAEFEPDSEKKTSLYRQCAEVFSDQLGDDMAAAEAYRQLLQLTDDPVALRAVIEVTRESGEPEELAQLLGRLIAGCADPEERRVARLEQAQILAEDLERPEDAARVLQEQLGDVPDDAASATALISVAQQIDDYGAMSEGLTVRLNSSQPPRLRAESAQQLAQLHHADGPLPDAAKLRNALTAWAASAPARPEPLRELCPVLRDCAAHQQLLDTLDALSSIVTDEQERVALLLESAAICAGPLGQPLVAMARLKAGFLARAGEVVDLAEQLAAEHGLHLELAQLHIARAKMAGDPTQAAADWLAASTRYEEALGDPTSALEAGLRGLAATPTDDGLLDRVERLAAKAGDPRRLDRVYDHLAQSTAEPEQTLPLLLRAARFFEDNSITDIALQWAMRACRTPPPIDEAIEYATRLAQVEDSAHDLTWLSELRLSRPLPPEQRCLELLRHAEFASIRLSDAELAMTTLSHALEAAEQDAERQAAVWALAQSLDQRAEPASQSDMRRAVIETHKRLAGSADKQSAEQRYLTAAELLGEGLEDTRGAYDLLRQATAGHLTGDNILDALHSFAEAASRMDGLDAHLSKLAKQATSEAERIGLLKRRGSLLADHLQRYDSAARVFREVIDRAGDPDMTVSARLVHCLRNAQRFQDLLKFYEDQLSKVSEPSQELQLLSAKATLLEQDMRNRARAKDAWLKVLAIAPDHREAGDAVTRLG